MEAIHMEMDQAINLAMWISQGQKCTKLNTFNMCNLQFQHLQYTLFKMYICLNCSHNCLTILTTYLKTYCTYEYQLKLEKKN